MTTLPWMPSSWASLSTTWHGLNKQLVLTGPQPLHLTPHQLSLPCRMLWPHQRTDLPKFTCSPMSPAHDSYFSLAVFTISFRRLCEDPPPRMTKVKWTNPWSSLSYPFLMNLTEDLMFKFIFKRKKKLKGKNSWDSRFLSCLQHGLVI